MGDREDSSAARDQRARKRAKLRALRVPPIPVSSSGFQRPAELSWEEQVAREVAGGPERTLNEARNNLCGLSQYDNLFFVACHTSIYVFQPEYPEQAFPPDPVLILTPESSRAGLAGYLDPGQPQAINHLVVADLGTEEIVVCTRDDGDVFAYRVSQVKHVLPTAHLWQRGLIAGDGGIAPFFHRCLGLSVWGIAVHQQARMIAFSSNLHVVTVYAFGLAADASADEVASTSHSGVRQLDRDEEAIDEDSDSILTEDGGVSLGSSSSIDEQEDSLSDSGESSYEGGRYHLNSDLPHSPELFEGRKQDFVIQLGQPNRVRDWRQHNANIPNIAFCNTAEDPYGRFLISSDIDARTIVWDLKYASPVRFLYRQEYDDFTAGGMDFRRSGWGALWLDKQMFSHASTVYQACGTEELGFTYEETSHYDHQCVFSNTKCLDYIPGNNKRWMGVPHPDEPMESPAPAVRSDATSPINTPLLDPTSAPDLDDEDDEVDSTRITARMTEAVYRSLSAEEARNYHSMFWPFMTMSFHLPESTTPIPSTPLLLLSMETMHLFQSADFQAVSSTSPVVFMDKPFHQRIGPDVDETLLLHFDRINLSVQIPELGVVIVGSGKGRVAVCTLHQTTQNPLLLDLDRAAQPGGRTGAADRSADGAHSPRQDNPIYTFRVDHILPFQWQETMGQRPETWLVGIAASPLQGMTQDLRARRGSGSGACAARRWRIILTYLDFTTLSYEIGHGSGSVVGVIP